ncbi:hypothetical protein DSO57_1007069 [Entomophthora muscae]|uniref:Uncharacterized protein n=1 Tax=Entomophthora muscae TaxID=34485 RepID=A0ACC2RYM2_9FUNG|nr:hypothetical protein DSO57_1007069 [Entomophthora muscae]
MNCTAELNPCQWHTLATKKLDSVLFASVQDCEEAFIKINEQWLFEPQQITKTILRADILKDTKSLPEEGSGLLRTTYRSLLPRSPHKDTFIFQKVELLSSPEAVIVEHTPLFCPRDPELPSDFSDFDITTLAPCDCCQDKYPSFHPEVSGYRLYLSRAESVVKAYACFKSEACLDAHSSKAVIPSPFNIRYSEGLVYPLRLNSLAVLTTALKYHQKWLMSSIDTYSGKDVRYSC